MIEGDAEQQREEQAHEELVDLVGEHAGVEDLALHNDVQQVDAERVLAVGLEHNGAAHPVRVRVRIADEHEEHVHGPDHRVRVRVAYLVHVGKAQAEYERAEGERHNCAAHHLALAQRVVDVHVLEAFVAVGDERAEEENGKKVLKRHGPVLGPLAIPVSTQHDHEHRSGQAYPSRLPLRVQLAHGERDRRYEEVVGDLRCERSLTL